MRYTLRPTVNTMSNFIGMEDHYTDDQTAVTSAGTAMGPSCCQWHSHFLDAAFEDQPTTTIEDVEESVVVRRQVALEGLPDLEPLQQMLFELWDHDERQSRPFASAPIRSRPRRTYDPGRVTQDPEGEYIPSYLASLSRRRSTEWHKIKSALEEFGQRVRVV